MSDYARGPDEIIKWAGSIRKRWLMFKCPSAWRISQPYSLWQAANMQTAFISCWFPPPYSLFVASISCMSAPFASLFFSVPYPHFLFPLPRFSLSASFCSRAAFWVNLRRCLFMLEHYYQSARGENLQKHADVWAEADAEFKSLSPQIWCACSFFCWDILLLYVILCLPSQEEGKMIRCTWMILNAGFLVWFKSLSFQNTFVEHISSPSVLGSF